MKRHILTALLALTAATAAHAAVSFIEDDYTKAIARAKEKNVPVFVEAWAPW